MTKNSLLKRIKPLILPVWFVSLTGCFAHRKLIARLIDANWHKIIIAKLIQPITKCRVVWAKNKVFLFGIFFQINARIQVKLLKNSLSNALGKDKIGNCIFINCHNALLLIFYQIFSVINDIIYQSVHFKITDFTQFSS